jgi:ParB family chromosome partitioning protein
LEKILHVREIPLDELVIGESQVRVRRVDADIDELVVSIRTHGLLEPILVYGKGNNGGAPYEVIAGQRRLQAHRRLGRKTILSAVIDEPVDQEAAKVLSLTENIVRRDLDAKDIIDVCTAMYKKYGSARAVADETGIPYAQVLKHLKYERLHQLLRHKVDAGEIPLAIALKAQDTATDSDGNVDAAEAVDLAEVLTTMTGVEREQILKEKRRKPDSPVKVLLEKFWQDSEKNRQILVTIPAKLHKALQIHAKELGVTQDEVAARLIAAGLQDHDLITIGVKTNHTYANSGLVQG